MNVMHARSGDQSEGINNHQYIKLLGFVGYKAGLLGKLKLKDSAPKTVFTRSYKELEPPNITLCDH